ncbi:MULTISPECIES: cation:proton antiporter [unclassified Massilia]|uniref:cation:proton antiporter domain-containing protein n=1 Tax=unclassified Massilia TaxID=2609279 RepID=UPI001B827BD6|nr:MULTISPECIES: cation:proton antiporter [unclassified Massilia]MBQ5940970.1 cation:proton antiporter [Massilia sp. AB1]MBQ5963760.1 cation:proton antiporter [Massilia sp. ZL223]
MNDELSTPLWLLSPLAVLGAGLMLALVLGLLLQRFKVPKLYGAVIAGLLLGATGLDVIDRALLTQFQELLNAAAALVLFEVGRKMDLAWLLRSGRQGASLLLATVLRGAATAIILALLGLPWSAAIFIGSILIAVNPVIVSSMVADENASGTSTFATNNMVGISNLVALLALGLTLAWTRSHGVDATAGFGEELVRQGGKLVLGALIAVFSYGVYALATRLCKVPATMRPGMLLAALLIDLGLCSISAASALLSLLLMGVLLRNVEKRDNVFQAQLKTAQDIGYVLLFLMSAALVDLRLVLEGWIWVSACVVFAVRIAATRVALWPATAWSERKKHAMALSMCSLVSYGGLVVDNSLNAYTGLDPSSTAVMNILLALNVLLAPGLTWLGLRLAGETYRGGAQ